MYIQTYCILTQKTTVFHYTQMSAEAKKKTGCFYLNLFINPLVLWAGKVQLNNRAAVSNNGVLNGTMSFTVKKILILFNCGTKV